MGTDRAINESIYFDMHFEWPHWMENLDKFIDWYVVNCLILSANETQTPVAIQMVNNFIYILAIFGDFRKVLAPFF